MKTLLFLTFTLIVGSVYATDDRNGKDTVNTNTVKLDKGVLLIKTLPGYNKTPVLKPKDHAVAMPNAFKVETKTDTSGIGNKQRLNLPMRFPADVKSKN